MFRGKNYPLIEIGTNIFIWGDDNESKFKAKASNYNAFGNHCYIGTYKRTFKRKEKNLYFLKITLKRISNDILFLTKIINF